MGKRQVASENMIDSSFEFLPLKNISLYLLNLGAPPVSQEGEERKISWIIQINTSYKNCNWLAKIKTWSIKATSFFYWHLKKDLSSPLSLGRVACKPRGRGEGKTADLSKLTHRIKTAIAYLKHDQFKLWLFTVEKISLHL